jgi:hypothetical protein
MSKYTYQVFENNGGTLTLFVFDKKDDIIYMHFNYEHTVGKLRADIEELKKDTCNVEEWDGCEVDGDKKAMWKIYDQEYEFSQLIADIDGIYPERMGAAGSLEFDVE